MCGYQQAVCGMESICVWLSVGSVCGMESLCAFGNQCRHWCVCGMKIVCSVISRQCVIWRVSLCVVISRQCHMESLCVWLSVDSVCVVWRVSVCLVISIGAGVCGLEICVCVYQ